MTKLVQGAYIILQVGNKGELAKVTFADGDTFKAVLERDKEKDEKSPPVVKFERGDVMAVLGKRPKNGSVYGQKIEPLVRRIDVPYWGPVRIYNFFDDHQIKLLKDGLKAAHLKLKELRVLNMFQVEVEIRQPQGKYAGYYKYRPKAETDILCIKPELTFDNFVYYMFHEYAHGMWYRGMTAKMRFAWVKLYHEYITLQEIEEKELEDILGEIESAESIRAFQAEADDESKLILKKVLKHINEVHGLNVKHLEMALENGDSIKDYWPTFIEMSETEACITDYARKSPEEFFAEAIAHKFEGRKLPKKVEALYELTMARLVKGGGAEVKREKKEEEVKKKKKKIRDEEVDVDSSGGNKLKKKKKKRMDGLK